MHPFSLPPASCRRSLELFGPGNWFRSVSCANERSPFSVLRFLLRSPCLQFGRKISVTLICRCCSLANGFVSSLCVLCVVCVLGICVWHVHVCGWSLFLVFPTANCWWRLGLARAPVVLAIATARTVVCCCRCRRQWWWDFGPKLRQWLRYRERYGYSSKSRGGVSAS